MTEEPPEAGESNGNEGTIENHSDSDAAPLSGLRRDVAERRRRNRGVAVDDGIAVDDGDSRDAGAEGDGENDADGGVDADNLFSDVDLGEVDEEAVWAELEASGDDPLFTTEEGEAGREVSVVKKRLCHECPYFADPPDLSCTHDGTEIDAEVDTGHFRVLDCPMVDRPEHADAAGLSEDNH